MHAQSFPSATPPGWIRVVAVIAGIFGLMTLFSGGSVLFGPQQARAAAGNYLPFVVWFNFLAGFAYVAAAAGIWLGRDWVRGLAWAIALATAAVAVVFVVQVLRGQAYEARTVGALALRFAIWAGIAAALGTGRWAP